MDVADLGARRGVAAEPWRPADWLAVLLVLAAVLVLYRPALELGFVDYDDPQYVTGNPHVLAGLSASGLRWTLSAVVGSNWHPVTLWSHLLDVELFGANPRGHHLTSVLLHAGCALLLFVLLRLATGERGPAFAAAGLFAVHPLQVESVAWVSQRKTVLSVLLLLLAMIAYTRWRERRGGMVAVAVLLSLGLAAKPILVLAPLGFLLFDRWPLARPPRARLLTEKWILAVPCVAAAAATLWAQRAAIAAVAGRPFGDRMAAAVVGVVEYLGRIAWPTDLAVLYPYPHAQRPGVVLGAAALLLAFTAAALLGARRFPFLLFGWGWFLVHLVPTSGVVAVGHQATADRYLYLPLLGLMPALVWGLRSLLGNRVAWALFAVAIAGCAVLTRQQLAAWRDTVALFEHALAVTERNFVAHQMLGVAHDAGGRRELAREHFEQALLLAPDSVFVLAAYGEARRRWGESEAAIALLRRAAELAPAGGAVRFSLAMALDDAGDRAGALDELRAAVDAEPGFARAHYGLGVMLEATEELAAAETHYRRAAELEPDLPGLLAAWGRALAALGRAEEARAVLGRAAPAPR